MSKRAEKQRYEVCANQRKWQVPRARGWHGPGMCGGIVVWLDNGEMRWEIRRARQHRTFQAMRRTWDLIAGAMETSRRLIIASWKRLYHSTFTEVNQSRKSTINETKRNLHSLYGPQVLSHMTLPGAPALPAFFPCCFCPRALGLQCICSHHPEHSPQHTPQYSVSEIKVSSHLFISI